MGVQLSPLNFSRLIANLRSDSASTEKKSNTEMVTMYRCLTCQELHDWEDDAEECCSESGDGDSMKCPICGEKTDDYHAAANCCLWKDIDANTRYRIAEALEAGSTWEKELGVNEFGRTA